jgi:hypothetical protein
VGPGETKTLNLLCKLSVASFVGGEANGVVTQDYGFWPRGFVWV